MKESMQHYESDVIEHAMAAFLRQALNAKSKNSRIKYNMECRRKLEIKMEEQRLQREISEFDFN
ncbi:PA3496 family putative envelope integrity protein [Cellvibrio sp.]|uniref:PA3496 family putative envelope integrity protein n=1 Tax=Cellvibrio sp. TaxID=1965322 RepID=UPI003964848C